MHFTEIPRFHHFLQNISVIFCWSWASPSTTQGPHFVLLSVERSGTIRENYNAYLVTKLQGIGKPVFDLQSNHAAYEFVPDHGA